MNADVTAVMTAHHEGSMATPGLTSFLEAIDHAREALSIDIEPIVMLDRPDSATIEELGRVEDLGCTLVTLDLGDQGLVRNEAVRRADGRMVAFLDADDLWSTNWLTEAYRIADGEPSVIVHPEMDWFFGDSGHVFLHADQTDPQFRPGFLRLANYWDALCLAPRQTHVEHPYARRDVEGGFAYEDWHWNLETLAAGHQHRVARGTIHFKRRRDDSQTMKATAARVLTRPSPMLSYAWPGYAETRPPA